MSSMGRALQVSESLIDKLLWVAIKSIGVFEHPEVATIKDILALDGYCPKDWHLTEAAKYHAMVLSADCSGAGEAHIMEMIAMKMIKDIGGITEFREGFGGYNEWVARGNHFHRPLAATEKMLRGYAVGIPTLESIANGAPYRTNSGLPGSRPNSGAEHLRAGN